MDHPKTQHLLHRLEQITEEEFGWLLDHLRFPRQQWVVEWAKRKLEEAICGGK